MDVGIFAKIFGRPTLEDTLEGIYAHGIRYVQFNMACAGLPTLPEHIPPELVNRIRQAFSTRYLTMSAISGTYNMIHPDPTQREVGLSRLFTLAQACSGLGVRVITVCTGTRDPENMWRTHPANNTAEAWHDLITVIRRAAAFAEQAGVQLGIEPELSNVVDSAVKARRLQDEVGSPALKIVMDGSNLLRTSDITRMPEIFHDAFQLLGNEIVLAHAKDLLAVGSAEHGAAGTGVLDYDLYLNLLQTAGYDGPLILHTLEESQVDQSVAFLRAKIAAHTAAHQ
jgi:sugar phosphate isomerase/epimerase